MKPNIIFILTDQQRRAALGFWQKEEYRERLLGLSDPVYTPNIDALADEGIVVSEAYSSYPVCSPFRAMLFSGLYPEENGVWQNCAPGRSDKLADGISTLTDTLAENGYSVGYVGKWHLEEPCADFDREGNYIKDREDYRGEKFFADGSPEGAPTCWDTLIEKDRQRGIDYLYAYNTYDVFRYREGADMRKTPRLFDKDYRRHIPPTDVWAPDYETDIAINFLKNEHGERKRENPFALFVCYNPPHSPYSSREDTDYISYDEHYKDAEPKDRLPRRENVTLRGEKFENSARVYFSHVSGIDRCVGRLLSALDGCGDADNTIVVYTSDHGEMMGSHGLMSKNVPYEEATAIPFIIRYPNALTHRVEPLFLTGVDIMPTLLGLAKVRAPEGLAGEDYSELLESGEGNRPPSALFMQQKRKGVRTEKYMLSISYGDGCRPGEILLFNLHADPYEICPLELSDIPKEDLDFLLRELGSWLKRSNDPWYKARLYGELIVYPED